jgi:hypothetical protein
VANFFFIDMGTAKEFPGNAITRGPLVMVIGYSWGTGFHPNMSELGCFPHIGQEQSAGSGAVNQA